MREKWTQRRISIYLISNWEAEKKKNVEGNESKYVNVRNVDKCTNSEYGTISSNKVKLGKILDVQIKNYYN